MTSFGAGLRELRRRKACAWISPVVVLMACCISAPSASAAASVAPDRATLKRVDSLVDDRMAANGVPSAAVAIVAGDRIVHARGFGAADGSGRQATAATPFLLGSTTKSFTALAVMQLVEDGKVDLDDPIRKWVPELDLAGDEDEGITVRQVLQHASGLPLNAAGGPILKSAADGTPEEAIGELDGKKLAFEPGSEMEYVNANYVLAGLVVERASGEPYDRYVQRHIFKPLGMRHSFADPAAAAAAGVAEGHRYVFGFTESTAPTFRPGVLAAGYLMSSARDMAKYLSIYLNGGVGLNGRRVISARGMRTLLTPGDPETHLGPWADSAPSHYAMGWFVGGPWQEPAILHPGDAADSSSLLVLLPDRDVAVVTLVSASNELPVPGNPFAIPRMERNVIDILVGESVETGTSVKTFYLVFDVLVALLLGLALLALVRAVRAARLLAAPRRRWLAIVAAAARGLVALIVLALPIVIGFGWRAIWSWHPDLGITCFLLGVMLMATTAIRVLWLVRTRSHHRRPPGAGEAGSTGGPGADRLQASA